VRPEPGVTGAGAWRACRPQRGTIAPACPRRDAGAVSCLAGRAGPGARRRAPGLGGRAGAPRRRLDDVVSSLRSFSATLLHVEHGRGVPDGVARGATHQTHRGGFCITVWGNKMLHKQATSTVNGLIPASVSLPPKGRPPGIAARSVQHVLAQYRLCKNPLLGCGGRAGPRASAPAMAPHQASW